jgi:hypothetical protein
MIAAIYWSVSLVLCAIMIYFYDDTPPGTY